MENNLEDEFLSEVETTIKTQKKKRKKGIQSKKKGNRGELELVHILNERFESKENPSIAVAVLATVDSLVEQTIMFETPAIR